MDLFKIGTPLHCWRVSNSQCWSFDHVSVVWLNLLIMAELIFSRLLSSFYMYICACLDRYSCSNRLKDLVAYFCISWGSIWNRRWICFNGSDGHVCGMEMVILYSNRRDDYRECAIFTLSRTILHNNHTISGRDRGYWNYTMSRNHVWRLLLVYSQTNSRQ